MGVSIFGAFSSLEIASCCEEESMGFLLDEKPSESSKSSAMISEKGVSVSREFS